ncbi:MAG: FxLYD domain-containing protein [Candidatus Bathyarchaeia archaeon]
MKRNPYKNGLKFVWLGLLLFLSVGLCLSRADAAASAQIVGHSWYLDSLGSYNIVGEVENTGSVNLIFVKVTATFYDSDDQVVGTEYSYAYLGTLAPGSRSPFHLIFTAETQVPLIDHYALHVSFQETTQAKPHQLVIKSHSNYTDSINVLHIVGEIENQGGYTEYVQVIATGYDEAGNVVAAEYTYTDPTDLAGGQKAPFDLMIYNPRAQLVKSYVIVAESRDYQ